MPIPAVAAVVGLRCRRHDVVARAGGSVALPVARIALPYRRLCRRRECRKRDHRRRSTPRPAQPVMTAKLADRRDRSTY